MAFQAGIGRAGTWARHGRRLAWSLVLLALGLALSACGLEGLSNPSSSSAATTTTTPLSLMALLAGGAAGAGSSDGNSNQSRFNAPQAVVSDGFGHVYVADTGNDTIRLMTATSTGTAGAYTWSTVTIAGAGTAGTAGFTDSTLDSNGVPVPGSAALFNNPDGLAIVPNGGQVAGTVLYVADFGNSTIRKVVLSGTASAPLAVVSTIAGTAQTTGNEQGVGSAAEFSGPIGLALNTVRNELYVADWGNNEVRRIDLAVPAVTQSQVSNLSPQEVLSRAPLSVAKLAAAQISLLPPAQIASLTQAEIASLTSAQSASLASAEVTLLTPAELASDYCGLVTDTECQYSVTLLAGHPPTVTITGTAVAAVSVDGSGSIAGFNGPQGLVVDPAGNNIYVADSNSNIIRQISLIGTGPTSYGQVTSISGINGTVGAVDSTVSTSTSTIVTAATTFTTTTVTVVTPGKVGTPAPSATSCPATLPANALPGAYIAACTQVVSANPNGGSGTTTSVGGPVYSIPAYNSPTALTLDASGNNLLIADTGNGAVRMLALNSAVANQNPDIVSTVAGELPVISSNLGGTSVITYFRGATDGIGTAARFNHPKGITWDSSTQQLVMADDGNNSIRSIADASPWTVATIGGAVSGFADNATGSLAGFNNPQGIGFDAAGNAYVADSGNNSIRVISSAGAVTTLAGDSGNPGGYADLTGKAALFDGPRGLAVDAAAGQVYVADTLSNCIRKIDIASQAVSTLEGICSPPVTAGSPGASAGSSDGTGQTASFNGPSALALDGQGHLYVADSGNDTIRQITLATGSVLTVAGVAKSSGSADSLSNVGLPQSATFNNPQGITVNGNLVYVADTGNDTIRLVTISTKAGVTTGTTTTLAGTVGLAGSTNGSTGVSFSQPMGLAMDGSGNLFVADYGNQTVRELTPAGVASTVAGVTGDTGFFVNPAPGLLSLPVGLASYGGSLYITMTDAVVSMSNLP